MKQEKFTQKENSLKSEIQKDSNSKRFVFESENLEGILCNKFIHYTKEIGYGFISKTSTPPGRKLAIERLEFIPTGVMITETNETSFYLNENNYDYGGIAFRIDLEEPGAYEVKVTLAEGTEEANVAVSGMNAYRLLDTIPWDAARKIKRTNYASWYDRTWTYEYVTGRNFIEIEIEPKVSYENSTKEFSYTVGVASIEIKKLERNVRKENDKLTIFTLGDSTVKSYIYEEAIMSGWGQVFDDLFDLNNINVINYSMGGRSVFNLYHEGRFNEILMIAKPGDYLLLQSGHNDESRGDEKGPEARFGRGNTEETYEFWLKEEYIKAIKARGIIPVFVTPMTRINKSVEEDKVKLNGFKHSNNPGIDFPGILKRIGEENDITVIDLYEESIKYLNEIGGIAAKSMFLSIEPGETPGKTNSGSYANGNPSGSWDGTHFKETLSKQWARIVATGLYQKGVPASEYLKEEVKLAIDENDWSLVYKEVAKDVISGSEAYYREQIECVCKHEIMFQDEAGYFHPFLAVTIKDFIYGMKAIWNVSENVMPVDAIWSSNDLNSPLTREVMAAIVLDFYEITFGKNNNGNYNKPKYMTDYNGVNLTPEDPNYDSNLVGESAQYYPLAGFDTMEDKDEISSEYYEKFRIVYELGLMRSEVGIERGVMKNGTKLCPKQIVTREKAAKELYFLRVLKKDIYEETDK